MTVAEFAKAAAQFEEDSRIDGLDVEGKEEKFWKSLHFQPPTYGADMLGTDPVFPCSFLRISLRSHGWSVEPTEAENAAGPDTAIDEWH